MILFRKNPLGLFMYNKMGILNILDKFSQIRILGMNFLIFK